MKDRPIPKSLNAILLLCFGLVLCGASSRAEIATPYTITGKVTATNGTPLANLVIFAATYINGTNYQAVNGVTDSNGMYAVHVTGNSYWFLSPDSYQNSSNLMAQGYLPLDTEYVKIGSTNGTANFVASPYSESVDELDGMVYDADKNPIVGVTVYAVNSATGQTNQTKTDVNGFYYFFVADETDWSLHVDCDQLSSKGYDCPNAIADAPIRDRNTCCQDFTVVPSTTNTPPSFFTGEVALGGNWYWMGPQGSNTYGFGYFNTVDAPYIFHNDLGWEYFIDAANASHGAYFYDFTDGVWWYTEAGLFPYMYDFKLNAWLFCAPQTGKTDRYQSGPRWFLNTSTQQWVNDL